jgi:hypothetical protein
MKIVQAIKAIKDIQKQIDDLMDKVQKYSSDEDDQDPVYGTVEKQTDQISSWMQAIRDLNAEIERLDYCIKKTNVITMVTIKLGDKEIKKPIASWIKRGQSSIGKRGNKRLSLSESDLRAWQCLRENTGRTETKVVKGKDGGDVVVKFRRYWDPKKRDEMMKLYASEPSIIDGVLEEVNATVDLIES